jgi:tetratricopeptide (TPR) repeat protein
VEIMEKLARDHPEMTKYHLALGVNLAALGHGFAWERKFPQAESAVQRSIAILEKLAADHPQDMRIAAALGDAYWRMQIVMNYRGDGQALEWSSRCIQVLRFVARRDPRNVWIGRSRLAVALEERGESRMRLGRLAEALADFEEVIELTHGTKGEELARLFRALTKARMGDLSELALWGDQVRDILKVGATRGGVSTAGAFYFMLCYDAACVQAALAQLTLRDQGKPQAERQRLADRDRERALGLLDKARSEDEFKDPILLDEIRRERLLDPLRSHPRFQLLMMDLAFPDDPFGS